MTNQRYYPQEAPASSGPARKWIITGHDRNGKPVFGWSAIGLEPPMKTANTAPSSALEPHYSLGEIATAWGISVRNARRIFRDMPGVANLTAHRKSLTSRSYQILRIPASVAARVHEQRSAGFTLRTSKKQRNYSR